MLLDFDKQVILLEAFIDFFDKHLPEGKEFHEVVEDFARAARACSRSVPTDHPAASSQYSWTQVTTSATMRMQRVSCVQEMNERTMRKFDTNRDGVSGCGRQMSNLIAMAGHFGR